MNNPNNIIETYPKSEDIHVKIDDILESETLLNTPNLEHEPHFLIKDVAHRLGYSTGCIRQYTDLFKDFLPDIHVTDKGYRIYSEADVQRLKIIISECSSGKYTKQKYYELLQKSAINFENQEVAEDKEFSLLDIYRDTNILIKRHVQEYFNQMEDNIKKEYADMLTSMNQQHEKEHKELIEQLNTQKQLIEELSNQLKESQNEKKGFLDFFKRNK